MAKFIRQYKGKDLAEVPDSKLGNVFWAGKKYDGNYVQIHKIGNVVTLFTSGGKPFYLQDLEEDLVTLNPHCDFIIETEFINLTTGLLGSRGKCTTTTWRTNTPKGIINNAGLSKFKCFDLLYYSTCNGVDYNCLVDSVGFRIRLGRLRRINLGSSISLVLFNLMDLSTAKQQAKLYCNEGGEGYFLFAPDHTYINKGRSNKAIKLKMKPTADLLCVGIKPGEGKYEGLIGSLLLRDDIGRTVNVGSGLGDTDRNKPESHFVGKTIEIEYEQILDTYIQPRYKFIREDK